MAIDIAGFRPRVKKREKLDTISREFKQCLIHQVFQHVLPANVDNERDFWLQRRNVSEVLLRSHTDINATWPGVLLQCGNHLLVREFIREEIFEAKVAIG